VPCNFVAAHAEHLPFASQSFDAVHMRSVIDHFRDSASAFIEAIRVLRPGDHLIVG
jgi:demethylmenaquinone methyltransferase/2-methoxy-6-polyprenyl-1,4-benzoquinol methylase